MAVQPARRAYGMHRILSRSRERRISFSNDPFPPGYVGAGGGEPERARRRPRAGAAPAADRGRGAGGDGGDADVHRHQCPVSGDGVAEGAASGETRMGGGAEQRPLQRPRRGRCSAFAGVPSAPGASGEGESVVARGSAAAVASRRDGAAAAAAAARARRARRRGGGAEGRPRRSTRAGAWRGWAEGGGGFLARTGCELERSCSSRRVRALEALSAAVARHGLTCGASFTMTGRTTPQAPSQPHDSPHELTTTLTAPPSKTECA